MSSLSKPKEAGEARLHGVNALIKVQCLKVMAQCSAPPQRFQLRAGFEHEPPWLMAGIDIRR